MDIKKNILNYNQTDSMIDITYSILKNNDQPISMQQLIAEVFEVKKIDIQDLDKVNQLYLDIILSGLFVFHGGDLWGIKARALHLWEQDYYLSDDETISLDSHSDENKLITGLDEFDLHEHDKDESEEDHNNKEIDIMDQSDYNLDHLELDDDNKEDEIIDDDYEYLYDK